MISLSVIIKLHIRASDFINLITESLYSFINFLSFFPLLQSMAAIILLFVSMSLIFFQILHVSNTMQYLSLYVQLISFIIMFSTDSPVLSQMVRFPSFLRLNNIPLCVCVSYLLGTFIHQCTLSIVIFKSLADNFSILIVCGCFQYLFRSNFVFLIGIQFEKLQRQLLTLNVFFLPWRIYSCSGRNQTSGR